MPGLILDIKSEENCLYRSEEEILSMNSDISYDSRFTFIDLDNEVPYNHVSSELIGNNLTIFDIAIAITCIDSYSVRCLFSISSMPNALVITVRGVNGP